MLFDTKPGATLIGFEREDDAERSGGRFFGPDLHQQLERTGAEVATVLWRLPMQKKRANETLQECDERRRQAAQDKVAAIATEDERVEAMIRQNIKQFGA